MTSNLKTIIEENVLVNETPLGGGYWVEYECQGGITEGTNALYCEDCANKLVSFIEGDGELPDISSEVCITYLPHPYTGHVLSTNESKGNEAWIGVAQETEYIAHCEICDVMLDVFLSEFGIEMEIEGWKSLIDDGIEVFDSISDWQSMLIVLESAPTEAQMRRMLPIIFDGLAKHFKEATL